jgi:hypothetical protein
VRAIRVAPATIIATVVAAVIVWVSCASPSKAQDEALSGIPSAQARLSSLIAQMVALNSASRSNASTHPDYLPLEQAFCTAIPRGAVSNWVGRVVKITDLSVGDGNGFTVGTLPPNGELLLLNVSTAASQELLLGNFYWMGVSYGMTAAWPPPLFPVGSPLNETTSGLRAGETVIFSGSFLPFTPYPPAGFRTAIQSCLSALNRGNYFSLFRFSSIRKV